jgi:protein SCO1/2
MKSVFLFARAAVIALAGLASVPVSAPAHSLDAVEQQQARLEAKVQFINRPAPEFALEDANGNPVRLADFRGKMVVLYFIYTSCPDVCPLNTQKIVEIQDLVAPTPMRERVQFIAITTDPVTDTPDIMRSYMTSHGVDPVNYLFLTSGPGQPMATRELAAEYGLKFTPTDDGYQMHGTITHVIDREARLRARYHGLDFEATNVVLYLNALSNDLESHPAGVADPAPARLAAGNSGQAAPLAPLLPVLAGIGGAIILAALTAFVLVRRSRRRI